MIPSVIPRVLNLQYRVRLEKFGQAFQENQASSTAHPCRKGCDACCYGPFDVGAADVWSLVEGLSELPPARRRRVMRRLAEQGAEQRSALGVASGEPVSLELLGDERFDAMCDALAEAACPFLEDGACVVYEHRPQICRMTGAEYVSGGEELDLGCPIGLTDGFAAIQADFLELDADIERIEERLELPGIGRGRTTIALGVDSVLRLNLAR